MASGSQTTEGDAVNEPTGLQYEKAMDDFVNAESHPEKCHHKIVNNHFGNVNLHKSLSEISFYQKDPFLTAFQHLSSTITAVHVAHLMSLRSAVTFAISTTGSLPQTLIHTSNRHNMPQSTIQKHSI